MSFYVFLSFLSAFQCHTKRHKDSGRAKSTSNAVDQSFLKNKELQQRFFHEEAYSGIPSGTVQWNCPTILSWKAASAKHFVFQTYHLKSVEINRNTVMKHRSRVPLLAAMDDEFSHLATTDSMCWPHLPIWKLQTWQFVVWRLMKLMFHDVSMVLPVPTQLVEWDCMHGLPIFLDTDHSNVLMHQSKHHGPMEGGPPSFRRCREF